MDKKKIKFAHPVPPFVRYCSAIIPTMFDDSLSYYEALCALNNFIQKNVVEIINNNAAISDSLIKQFEELKDYVEHYFDNLDVQEEINNKLDEMAEDGVFQDIVNAYLDSLTGKVQYIFPKSWDGLSGDANLIKAYGKTILIDTYRAEGKSYLYQMLSDYGVSHIDYLILTHYHDDHIGNAVNLIEDGYVDSTSYVYLPAMCAQISEDVTLSNYRNAILVALATYNVPNSVPAENSRLTIDDNFYIEFYNTDSDVLSTYVNYNNCSTLCKAVHLNKIAYYTGDGLGSALGRAFNNGFVNSHVDLYKVEHHGIQHDNNIFKTLNHIRPTYAYQPSFVKGVAENIYSTGTTTSFLKSIGTHLYSSHLNQDYIVFETCNNDIQVIQGFETPEVSNNNYLDGYLNTIYADSSASGASFMDGSSEYPFSDIVQAIGAATRLKSGKVLIALREGEYSQGHTSDLANEANIAKGNDLHIVISKTSTANIDNVKITGLLKFVNSNITFQNVTFKNNSATGTCLNVNNCTVNINSCKFDGSGYSGDATAINETDSNLKINACTASNYNLFISGHNGTSQIKGCTFNTITSVIYNRGGISIADNNSYTSVTNRFVNTDGGMRFPELVELFSGDAIGEITLNRKITDYNKIVAISGAVSGGNLYSDTQYSYFPTNFAANNTYNFKTYDGYISFVVSADGSKITLTQHGTTRNLRKLYGIKETID